MEVFYFLCDVCHNEKKQPSYYLYSIYFVAYYKARKKLCRCSNSTVYLSRTATGFMPGHFQACNVYLFVQRQPNVTSFLIYEPKI